MGSLLIFVFALYLSRLHRVVEVVGYLLIPDGKFDPTRGDLRYLEIDLSKQYRRRKDSDYPLYLQIQHHCNDHRSIGFVGRRVDQDMSDHRRVTRLEILYAVLMDLER